MKRSSSTTQRNAVGPQSWKRNLDADTPVVGITSLFALVSGELKAHAPFTLMGTLTGVLIMVAFVVMGVPRTISTWLFWSLHPLHVLLSALVTTAIFTLHSRRRLLAMVVVGYAGSVGIASLSDCIIPYVAESLLDLPNRGIHLGFIEKWWLVKIMVKSLLMMPPFFLPEVTSFVTSLLTLLGSKLLTQTIKNASAPF